MLREQLRRAPDDRRACESVPNAASNGETRERDRCGGKGREAVADGAYGVDWSGSCETHDRVLRPLRGRQTGRRGSRERTSFSATTTSNRTCRWRAVLRAAACCARQAELYYYGSRPCGGTRRNAEAQMEAAAARYSPGANASDTLPKARGDERRRSPAVSPSPSWPLGSSAAL